jgi:autotransporter translocation and assembly factor TamB
MFAPFTRGFGTNELRGGLQKDLQNQALSMAASHAPASQAIAGALGLNELRFTITSAGVGFGRYLRKNVYVSASQSTSDMQNRQAEIHYYLTPSVYLNTSASTNYGNEIKLQWHKDY